MAYPLTLWDRESESSINSRTYLGQFVLVFKFERVGGVNRVVVGCAVHVSNLFRSRWKEKKMAKGPLILPNAHDSQLSSSTKGKPKEIMIIELYLQRFWEDPQLSLFTFHFENRPSRRENVLTFTFQRWRGLNSRFKLLRTFKQTLVVRLVWQQPKKIWSFCNMNQGENR